MSQRTLPVPFPLKRLAALAPSFAALALSACVAPVGPVEVTRFHAPDTTRLGRGTIRVEPAPGQADGLEFRTYASAVAQELTRVGYTEPLPGQAAAGQVALLTLERNRYQPQRSRGPVSVGVGGATGGYGSGAGLGIGFDLSGAPKEQVETRVFVSIRDRNAPSTATALWEGRAAFVVRSDSPLAQAPLGAAKVAEALFKGFPGQSGETIQVK
ncbi:DUF4136 domain-containing protein [Novosphingobium panipatense]|uniref:DUF4136 domain-containing protein n=1 Tax=Novosphingobium panipatense TaxID=428991 RepID=A0ABY1QQG4_9SPHN|nr:DUF4136 domain-containing protein [Novosphingobium panipatense]SMP78117.1 protein of unknown function [Novosphingobium panipatense]